MNGSPHRLVICCNPANPVLYLACCGLFDLFARIDPTAHGSWRATAPTAFLLDTFFPEADFLRMLLDTFCTPARWQHKLSSNSTKPTVSEATFTPPNHPEFRVPLDWWFETVDTNGKAKDKSAWMMFTGQQTAESIMSNMVNFCDKIQKSDQAPSNLTTLLACETKMSGRFGFDPRSSRGPLDVGFSFNDLKLPADTAPFAELLAVFGLNSFFPCRTGRAGKYRNTRGWTDRDKILKSKAGFLYRLWTQALPISLARYAAVRIVPGESMLFSLRADDRGYYHNLSLSKTALSTNKNQ